MFLFPVPGPPKAFKPVNMNMGLLRGIYVKRQKEVKYIPQNK